MRKEYTREGLVCHMTASDVRKAEKEMESFCKTHFIEEFMEQYFGEVEDEGFVIVPSHYVCTNANVARELYNQVLGYLEYYNRLTKEYCEVYLSGREIDVIHDSY